MAVSSTRAVEIVGRVEVVGVGVAVEVFVEEVALVGSPGVEGVDAGLQVGEHAGQVVERCRGRLTGVLLGS